MLAIVDYGMGNVRSIYNAFNLLGEEVCITDDKNTLSSAEAIIVPGVGAFSDGMKNQREKNLLEILQKDNIYAVQFHPEKSQSTGIKLLKNFLDDIRK